MGFAAIAGGLALAVVANALPQAGSPTEPCAIVSSVSAAYMAANPTGKRNNKKIEKT